MRSIFTPTRDSFIPAGASKVADKLSDAVAYIYADAKGRPCARVFFGKQAKPVLHCYYRAEAHREADVRDYFERRRAWQARRADESAKRTADNTLTVGDILNTCWGYEQTNREFFEVVAVAGKHVIVREIAQVRESTGWETGVCVPQSGQFIGEPMRRLVQHGASVTIDRCRTARRWNTGEVAGVKVGPALHWSSYA